MRDTLLKNTNNLCAFDTSYMDTSDKRKLPIVTFHNVKNRQNGSVVVLQGMCDNFDNSSGVFSNLTKRGFSYAAFDWMGTDNIRKGQKKIPLKFDINRHINDLEEFLQTIVYPDCPPPYYFLCYDLGCLIAISALDVINNQCHRLIGVSPLFCPLGYKFSGLQHKISLLLNDAGFGRLGLRKGRLLLPDSQSNGKNNMQTSIEEYQMHFATPNRRWLADVLDAVQIAHENLQKNELRFPALFVAGNNDKLSDSREIQHFCDNVRLADVITIFGADHDILHASQYYQKQFWAIFDAFMHKTAALQSIHQHL